MNITCDISYHIASIMFSSDAKPFIPARKISPMLLSPPSPILQPTMKDRALLSNNPSWVMKRIYKKRPPAIVFVDMTRKIAVAKRTEDKAIADIKGATVDKIVIVKILDADAIREDPRDTAYLTAYVSSARVETWMTIIAMWICTHVRWVEYLSICACHADRSILRAAIASAYSILKFVEYDYELDAPIAPVRKQRMVILPPESRGVSRAHRILNDPRNARMREELSWLLSAVIQTRVEIDDFITTWGIARTPSDYDDDARVLRTLCAMFLILDSLDPDFPFDDRAISHEMRVYFRGRRDDFPANIPTYAPLTLTERAMIIAHGNL